MKKILTFIEIVNLCVGLSIGAGPFTATGHHTEQQSHENKTIAIRGHSQLHQLPYRRGCGWRGHPYDRGVYQRTR